jgi:hypothetical protein
MSKRITATGSLIVTNDVSVSGQGQDTRQIALGPVGGDGVKYCDDAGGPSQTIATSGNPGDNFEALDAAAGLSEIQMLFIRASAETVLRLYAIPAVLQALAGTFPTGFGGGESVTITIDGTAVVVGFLNGDQTAAQCAARINAACALAGLATPRATVVNGQLRIEGVATKVGSSGVGQIVVTAGAPATTLGIAAAAAPTNTNAQGQDTTINGLYLAEFQRTGSRVLTKAQVSGQATLDVVAAGRP